MAKDQHSSIYATVILEALNSSKEKLFEISIPVDEYYSDSHPLIDDPQYRKQKSIRHLHGRVYNYESKLDQEFKNDYDSEGNYLHGIIMHADGTIIED